MARECIGDVLTREGFKRPLAAMICKFEFEQDGRGLWVLRWSSWRNTSGIYPFRLGGWFGGEFFGHFVNILYRESRKYERTEAMHRIICCHSMLSALS